MKKVININFQGRVIPIEESAYELLKQYIDSLRRYFSAEEGREEIISDIENRMAELFSERIKKGATCITDADVNEIISSMGRPEDFEAQEAEGLGTSSGSGTKQEGYSYEQSYSYNQSTGHQRLYRNSDDKILGGVCSGLANYLRIDPVILRIVFVLLFGALFWVYILLWIIIPARSVESHITKRFYRSAEDKVVGGVCGGLAAYFNVDVWIPRLIFAFPLIIGLVSGTFHFFRWDWDFGFGPSIITSSLGSTLFITYVILWIVVPIATTASEKLEMRGERVDLNSIRDTIKGDMESFKGKAQNWGKEVRESAKQFSAKAREFGAGASEQARSFTQETAPVVRRTRSGLGHAIGVLFKAFFLFIAAIIALSLFGAFVGLLFGGMTVMPFKDFLLEGFWQNILAWSTLFLFIGIPIIALFTWLVRRIMGVRSRNHYLGYTFSSLWFIGLVSFIALFVMVGRNFRVKEPIETQVSFTQPSTGKIYVQLQENSWRSYRRNFWGFHMDEDWPFFGAEGDSLMLKTVRVNLVKSNDDSFHLYKVRLSRGSSVDVAREAAEKIDFDIQQQDSVLVLPRGFAISDQEKWRNQQVLVVMEIPMGKKVQFDSDLSHYEWMDIYFNRGLSVEVDDDWSNLQRPRRGVEYIMTPAGLERNDGSGEILERGSRRSNSRVKPAKNRVKPTNSSPASGVDSGYRYQQRKEPVKDTTTIPAASTYRSTSQTPVLACNEKPTASRGINPLATFVQRLW